MKGWLGFIATWMWILSSAMAGDTPILKGDRISPLLFANPYAHVPAQCYIETSAGTQNACQYCHNNGVYLQGLGNNPQAGLSHNIGNLQSDYSFAPYGTQKPLASINRWLNVIFPERLRKQVQALGEVPHSWDMQSWIRQDNWSAAYAQRKPNAQSYSAEVVPAFQLFPALAPQDLPAQSDGFVRTKYGERALFKDQHGGVTGWRSINFMPYGIFMPMTGSVSGIYVRLPEQFMKDPQGRFSIKIYEQNLDLLEKAIQGRLSSADPHRYFGAAQAVAVSAGVYPVGTEFAHPLHYVDIQADGSDSSISRFPGTRAQRVKEIRYMVKWWNYEHGASRPGDRAEAHSLYGDDQQGWIDNGAGWYLAGWIEDKAGALRPQNREELFQCLGCHSSVNRTEFPTFTSGVGNTVDSTWAMVRKFAGVTGWKEMNYLNYQTNPMASSTSTPGSALMGDPINAGLNKGEYRHFLDTVVGASLYGDMPKSMDKFFAQNVRQSRGYWVDWPMVNTQNADAFVSAQRIRQQLMREFTRRSEHLNLQGHIKGELLYPPREDALAAARRYRMVVVTQSYHLGKDVFEELPVSFRYFRRDQDDPYTKLDGTPYKMGERVIDRPVHRDDPTSIDYLIGSPSTLIKETQNGLLKNYFPDYSPVLLPGVFSVPERP